LGADLKLQGWRLPLRYARISEYILRSSKRLPEQVIEEQVSMRASRKQGIVLWCGLLAVLLWTAACSRKETGPPRQPAAPVTVATVAQRDVPVQLRAIGTVEAVSTITVKTMIGGEITAVHFKEGQDVTRGQSLFEIDRRPYDAALAQVQATLARDAAQAQQAKANEARDLANMKNAQLDTTRYADLLRQGVVSQQQSDQARTNSEALQAAVEADRAAYQNAQAAMEADRAAIDNARVNLSYCSIRSPIDGRTGALQAFQGNVVKSNDTVLLTITQVAPIYVTFSVPQQYLGEVKRSMAAGRPKVTAIISKDEADPEEGALSFVDNAVDTTTGTIKLKGTFPNLSRRLWPGQFVDVFLTLTTRPNAVLVPSEAVQAGQAGQYVFVVKADNTAESRNVVTGISYKGQTIIEKGLQPGERVITDGQLRVLPGGKVIIKGAGGPGDSAPGGSAPVKEARS
jgi:multidrug efflux system membrane fusion protein